LLQSAPDVCVIVHSAESGSERVARKSATIGFIVSTRIVPRSLVS
jgi:hypothetical protein